MNSVRAGLPPHGLLVLMPTSMHLSASSSQPPASLTLALSLQALAIQLSPAAVAILHTLGKVMHTSAVLPGQRVYTHEHARLHPHEQAGIHHAQTHTRTEGQKEEDFYKLRPANKTDHLLHAAASREAASHKFVPAGSGNCDFGSQPESAAAKAVHDDLRCGFFSMASVPAARPGEQWSWVQ